MLVNSLETYSTFGSSNKVLNMKWIKRIVFSLLALIAVAVLLLVVTGNKHILNGIGKTYLIGKSKPDIDDLQYFEVSDIKSDLPEAWPVSADYNKAELPGEYAAFCDSMETTALLVIQNDSLIFEKYSEGWNEQTLGNSFSMAKSFTAILVGVAIDEGYIKSLDQQVSDFIPELKTKTEGVLTIRHLLQMTSGIPFGESYNSPFGYMAKAYYGKDLINETLKYQVEQTPGTLWKYEGGNSVLLGMILERATGRSVSEYFFQKVWSCIGAENEAHWNLDKTGGMAKTFSGFYATARDFAKVGRLWLHDGILGPDTIVSPDFVRASITPSMVPDENGEPCDWYGLHWWLGKYNGESFYSCRGMRGQYIAVIPSKKLIVVRLGHLQNKEREAHMPPDLYRYIGFATSIAK